MIPGGTIKLVVTLREPPRMMTVMIYFLTVKCPSAFNRVLGRPLLKDLETNNVNSLLDNELPHNSEDGPSSRTTV